MDKDLAANTTIPLSDYFSAVDRRLARLAENGGVSFRIEVCGRIIELRFPTQAQAKLAAESLPGCFTREAGTPDAVFQCWQDDCVVYLPAGAENQVGVWQSWDESGYLQITTGYGVVGANLHSRTFYSCRQPPLKTQIAYGHEMVQTFFQWARASDMLLLHSAAVGVDGRGVLIAARGGGGKSTLAVSCLLDGMDFVADDYVLANAQGPLRAMPLYMTVGLNPDMVEKLQPDMPVIRSYTGRAGKLLLDASGYPFCPELTVGAVVFPKVTDRDTPRIVPTPPGPVLTRLIHSSAQQMGLVRNPEPVRAMAERLSGLPVYEIELCGDLQKNAKALREFIKREI